MDWTGGLCIGRSTEAHQLRLVLFGELDVASSLDLLAAIKSEHIAHHTIVLDLALVTFIDCAGLAAIIDARDQAEREGRELRVDPAVSKSVRRLVDLTGEAGRMATPRSTGWSRR